MPDLTSVAVEEEQGPIGVESSVERPAVLPYTDASLVSSAKLPSTYEELVTQSPQGSIFAHRWWLEAVAPGMYEILEVNEGDGIQAAWPIVYHKSDGAKHVCMPPLTQKLGILFAPSDITPVEMQSKNQQLAAELIEQLGDIASFHQNFHENFTDWLPFYWQGYAQSARYTYVLEDISDLTSVWNGMRPNHRRDIRKAAKSGIRIIDTLDTARFLELNRKTFARQGREPLASDELILRLDTACCANAGRKIFAGVDSQGRIHAAVYIAWANDTAYYLMGGSEPNLRKSGAQLLALWEAMIFASSVAKRFDFEGSMLQQVEHGFRGFGAGQLPYSSITKVPPTPTSLSEFLKTSVKQKWNWARRTIANRLREP